MTRPADRLYTAEHEWVQIHDGVATVGITDFAANALGDVVFVELPAVGDELVAGQTCGEIESTKSVSDIFAPVSGTVAEINDSVVEQPESVNQSPFESGWLFRVAVAESAEQGLLSAEDYEETITS